MTKTVSALKARRNLGELLNKAYYKGEETVIEKKGRPFAKITGVKNAEALAENALIKTAGAWKDLDTEVIKKKIRENRRDGSSKKKFLTTW